MQLLSHRQHHARVECQLAAVGRAHIYYVVDMTDSCGPPPLVHRYTPKVKAAGADLIIPLCHLYEPQDERTAREFDFPVILSGHDHRKTCHSDGHVPRSRAAAQLRSRLLPRWPRAAQPRSRAAAQLRSRLLP